MENETKVDAETTEKESEGAKAETEEVEVEDTESEEAEAEEKSKAKPKLSDEQQLAIHKRETKKLEKRLGLSEKPKAEVRIEKSNEPDYGRIAYLKSEGITHSDDRKIVLDEAERLKLSLTDVVEMEHIKTRLQSNRDQREAQAGLPKGKGRTGGTTPHDVEYHLAKGTTPDDQELAQKVVNARMKKESNNKFSDSLYTG